MGGDIPTNEGGYERSEFKSVSDKSERGARKTQLKW